MADFGTGTAQKIWKWWEDFHNEHVRNEGFLGLLKGIIPFLIAIIGTILLGIVDIIVEFGKWFGGLFNQTDDDDARDLINSSSCDTLRGLSNDRIIGMINSMLDGPTGDDDENAMLRLFNCLPCDRLRTIVGIVGRANIEDDFHGSEYDRLRVRFGNCGIISMQDWDDDATRVFINSTDCPALRTLSMNNIKALLRNLFDGATGDADERAIIKLIRCLPEDTVRDLLREPGFSRDDFDDEVDGSEWRELRDIFDAL